MAETLELGSSVSIAPRPHESTPTRFQSELLATMDRGQGRRAGAGAGKGQPSWDVFAAKFSAGAVRAQPSKASLPAVLGWTLAVRGAIVGVEAMRRVPVDDELRLVAGCGKCSLHPLDAGNRNALVLAAIEAENWRLDLLCRTAGVTRLQGEELERLLADPELAQEAMAAIQALITRIALTPRDEGGLAADLHGDLAQILLICEGAERTNTRLAGGRSRAVPVSQVSVVAGARLSLRRTVHRAA